MSNRAYVFYLLLVCVFFLCIASVMVLRYNGKSVPDLLGFLSYATSFPVVIAILAYIAELSSRKKK